MQDGRYGQQISARPCLLCTEKLLLLQVVELTYWRVVIDFLGFVPTLMGLKLVDAVVTAVWGRGGVLHHETVSLKWRVCQVGRKTLVQSCQAMPSGVNCCQKSENVLQIERARDLPTSRSAVRFLLSSA